MTVAPAFLFDLDGTLADTLADIAASTNHVRAAFGLPAVDLATARTFVGDGARTLLRRALAPVEPSPSEAFLDRAFATYAAHHAVQCTVEARLFAGVREHLEHLAERGHPLAVVTNKPERFAVPVCEHLGLVPLLGAIVGGDTAPRRKPDPAPLRLALERLGAPAAGATMVGDGPQDVRAGKALGMTTIACLYGYHDPDALRAEGATVHWRAFGMPE